jgi:membrane fusion protein (multidrug efflux system)
MRKMIMSIRWRDVLIALSVGALAGCSVKEAANSAEKSTARKPVYVTVEPIERRQVERTVEVVGSLKGWEDVTVGSKRMGRVLKVHHDIGDHVKPGDPIVELEASDTDLMVAQAQRSMIAQLEQVGLRELPNGKFDESNVPAVVQARFALEKARQNLARERNLRTRGAGTMQDFQNAEIDERAADAALENARLNARAILANAMVSKVALEVVKNQRNDMVIRAPIPSKRPNNPAIPITYAVTKRVASEGQMLKEGEAVVDLVVENPLRLWTNVPEKFSADVKRGQEVRLSVASYPGRTFLGKIRRINPSVDATSRTFQVETEVPNDEGMLRPGGFAKASIVVKRDDDALTVPISAVVRTKGITKIFVVTDALKAKTVQVETGLEGSGWIEVIGAIPSEARVVTTGQSTLTDLNELAEGTTLLVKDPKAATIPPTPTAEADPPRPPIKAS